MISPVNFPNPLSERSESAAPSLAKQENSAEIVYTQTVTGQYLSFCWAEAVAYGINAAQLSGLALESEFRPVLLMPYRQRLQRVLANLAPEACRCQFHCGERLLWLHLIITPLLLPDGTANCVAVMGRVLPLGMTEPSAETEVTGYSLYPCSDRYQKLLTHVATSIRQTLDLETIWQQTVETLGNTLSVSRCIICPVEKGATKVKVVAEYRQESFPSLLGAELLLDTDPWLQQALKTLQPVSAERMALAPAASVDPCSCAADIELSDSSDLVGKDIAQARLMVATCYQEQPNGIMMLYQCDHQRLWSAAEVEFMQELANQVGTAIAHARLFAESQELAHQLQKVNHNLVQKHRELEEARHQAEEASRLKSEFLANTSHELRTPLNGMLGFLKLILDEMTNDPEEQREFIQEAYDSALRLLDILTDVLDLAKIEAGRLQIDLSPVNLDKLLMTVEKFIQVQIQHKHLSFEIQKPPTHDEIILFSDYKRLLQVMLNLVGNAIKFTHEGGITISTEVIRKRLLVNGKELPGELKVRVADTGIGVSLEKQDQLFQSFSQVDGSSTRQYGGTGLGLAISQKLVEAMGGTVNFYSMGEGLGSTVTFTVPLYQDPVMITG
jgi:signal transduction histidine kinase